MLWASANSIRSVPVALSANANNYQRWQGVFFFAWTAKSLTSVSLQKHSAPCCVLLNQYPQTQYPCLLSPAGTTEAFHQLRITQLMGTGAQTLIVPDTNTTAFLVCISILHVSVGAGENWVTKTLRLVSEYITSSSGHADLILLTYPGILISPWKQLLVIHCWACLHYAASVLCRMKKEGKKKKRKSSLNSKDEVPNRVFIVGSGAGCRKHR